MKNILIAYLLLASLLSQSQESTIDSLRQVANQSTGKKLVDAYNKLSWEFKNSNLDSSKYYAFKAIETAKTLKKDKIASIASGYNSLANTYEALGKMDSAEVFHIKSLEAKISIGDSLGMAASYNNLGIVYDLTDRNEKSLEAYYMSLRLYQKHTKDPFEIAMVQVNIGIVLKKLKEYEQALEHYEKALAIYEQQKSKFGITVIQGNIGSLLINLGRYSEAVEYSQRAKEGYLVLNYVRYVPYVMHNMAIAQDSLKEYGNAERNYLEVIKAHEEFENHLELASSQNALANLYLKQKKYSLSKNLAEKAIANAHLVQSGEFETKAVKTLANAEMGLLNFARAATLLNQYIIGRDSLFESEKTKQIFELQTKYETEQKENQLAQQQIQISEQELVNQRNKILIWVFSGALILLILIGIQGRSRLKWKNRQLLEEQKRLAREAEMSAVISSQEKERNRFARDLHDGFGQLISTLNLNLKNLKSPKHKDDRERVFSASTEVLEEMYQELKNICFDLMPQTLIRHGLDAGLNELANRINISGKIHVEINVFGLNHRLTELQEISLYRVSQEWVNNVLKYSDATHITIQITCDDAEITLMIEDNGLGFDKAKLTNGSGNGWKNMHSRANLISGEIELDTQPNIRGNALVLNAAIRLKSNEQYAVLEEQKVEII